MRYLYITLSLVLFLSSCRESESRDTDDMPAENTEQLETMAWKSFGEEIESSPKITLADLSERYKNMKVDDTLETRIQGTIQEVCTAKGCWAKLALPGTDELAFVKFKDYGFFIPVDSQGDQIILEGKAFLEETPVDEQKHYLEDAGASPEEIAAVVAPKRTYRFLASGALVAPQTK